MLAGRSPALDASAGCRLFCGNPYPPVEASRPRVYLSSYLTACIVLRPGESGNTSSATCFVLQLRSYRTAVWARRSWLARTTSNLCENIF